MPSGYEKTPDYGSPDPTGRKTVAAVALMLAVAGFAVWLSRPTPKPCWTLGEDEIEYEMIDGKQKATLRLDRIPKGECVTIKPTP